MFSAVSKHTPREGKIDKLFNENIVENTLNHNFLRNLKSLYKKIKKFWVKNSQFFITILFLSNSEVLTDDKTSINRVQVVVKLSLEIDPKIFSLQ